MKTRQVYRRKNIRPPATFPLNSLFCKEIRIFPQNIYDLKFIIKISLFIALVLQLFACNNEPDTTTIEPNPDSMVVEKFELLQIEGHPISLVVTTQIALIRAEPSLNAPEIARKVKGDSVIFTNKVTAFNTAMQLEGTPYNEPWLRVILEDNQMGWIYGGCINFKAAEHPALKEKVLDQRAIAFFGQSLAQQIAIYQRETKTASTLPAFRALYSRAQLLKDSLEKNMNIFIKTNSDQTLPNFFWLNELMDGMVVHYVVAQNQYYLFRDFKFWKAISLRSVESTKDDAFMELMLATYPSDSMEYYFYGWQLLDSNKTCSLLGSNIHSNVLGKIELALDSIGYFTNEVMALKQAILDDISISNYYWLSLDKIQAELDAIIQRKYAFLKRSDWVEIKTRRQLLLKYMENNIVVMGY